MEQEKQIDALYQTFSFNNACNFKIVDFDSYESPILEINCQQQFAQGRSAKTCNTLVEGTRYFQNLAPHDVENSIPDLNSFGYDPNVFFVSE